MASTVNRTITFGFCHISSFRLAILTIVVAISTTAMAATPVVVWDGDSETSNFSSLTKTVNDNTYTLNLNAMNSVAQDGSYVQIGNENQKAAITITAVNNDASVTNGFGTAGAVTVIMKYTDLPVSAGSNRALISLLDSQKYKGGVAGADNSIKVGVSKWNSNGYYIWQGGYTNSFSNVEFSSFEQTAALVYSCESGIAFYLDGAANTKANLKDDSYTTPCGVALGGVDTDGSSQYYALTGMKIKAVAIFTSALTSEEIAGYKFPSVAPILVSEINNAFGSEEDITVDVADGKTIVGDTTFNATNVKFRCDGSFGFAPPAGSEAELDFSGVKGRPMIIYNGVLPEVRGTTFTSNSVPDYVVDPSKWTGTIWLKNIEVTDFTVNPYGNESSIVRLTTIWGWLRAPGNYAFTNSVPVELHDEGSNPALNLTNGNSADTQRPNRCTVFKKLLGDGSLRGNSTADKVVVVVLDASDFAGGIGLNNGKIVVFGETMPEQSSLTAGSIVVMEGASVTAQPASGTWWATGGIQVDGELCAASLNCFGDGTTNYVGVTGTFTLMRAGGTADFVTDYSRVQGAGSIEFAGTSWYTLPTNGTLSASLGLKVSQTDGVVVPPYLVVGNGSTNGVWEVGSLSGDKNVRCDWDWIKDENYSRTLRVLQSSDTTWRGKLVNSNGRMKALEVQPGTSSAGTLTLEGEQTTSNNLVVAGNASVDIKGTWVGPVSVAGSIACAGTIDGSLTISDGATVFVNGEEPITVTGDVTLTGNIAIVVADDVDVSQLVILRATGDGATLNAGDASFTAIKENGKTIRARVTAKGKELRLSKGGFYIHLQ